jgi:PAS domain S-box-containing protein
MREAWPEITEQGYFEKITRVYTTGEVIYENEAVVHIDTNNPGKRTDVYCNFVYQPVTEADGKISGVMVHGINVTDQVLSRNKVQESESRLRRIVDSNMVGIMFYDESGRIFDANDAFLEIVGYSREDIASGTLLWGTISPKEYDSLDKKARKEILRNGVCTPYEKEFIRKNETRIPVYIGAAKFENNENTGVAFVLDISERKRLERQKDEFIGVATHELKTPVTSIKAYTQILQHRFMKEGDTRSSDMLSKMDMQLNKLISLISDLLDVTKIEGGKLSFMKEEFVMDELVSELVEELQRTTAHHTITITGNIQRSIIADRDRTGQVVTNLITNAIKYSPSSNKIVVHLKTVSDGVQVSVQDFGVGIPLEKQSKVFERFYRVSGPKEDTFPGLGLGLYISSEIIKRQGGKIWVESIEKEGSTFGFTLPFEPVIKKKKKV